MANRVRNEAKELQWREHMSAWQQSELSIRQYCLQHHVNEPNFYAWRRELARRDEVAGLPPPSLPSAASAARAKPTSITWMPIMVTSATSPLVEVQLPTGTVLRVPAGVESTTLERILTALHQMSAVQEARR